jgi:uncharacterized membrane protein
MNAQHATQIIEGYLARLEAELAGLPADRRRELVRDVRDHIDDSRATLEQETDADLHNIVDRLGEPSELAQEAREREEVKGSNGQHWGWVEVASIVLTILVWPAGAILVWLSRVWSHREKLIGTLIGAVAFIISFPLFAPLVGPTLGRMVQTLGGPTPLLIPTLGFFNVIGAIYLAVRLTRREAALSRVTA